VVDSLHELCRNANIGKYRHFSAAARAKHLNDRLGLPVVAINIILGSVFFVTLSTDIPDVAKWAGGFLALSAALISGISTFFNFGKLFEGHRGIGNKYVALAARCSLVSARYEDGLLDLNGVDAMLSELHQRYTEINDEAKAFATTDKDFANAIASEDLRARTLRDREQHSK